MADAGALRGVDGVAVLAGIVVWSVVAEANRYFAGEAPWALAKTDPARQKTVLYVTAEVVRQIAILALPVAAGWSSVEKTATVLSQPPLNCPLYFSIHSRGA